MFAEVFAHQIEGKRVHAGVGEGQNASAHTGDKVPDGGVHLAVVERAIQVDHVTGQPGDCKQANKHQHRFSQTLPGVDLRGTREQRKTVLALASIRLLATLILLMTSLQR